MTEPFPESLIVTVNALRERQAEDLRVLYVRDVSTVTDYFVLATANSAPHLRALAEETDSSRKDARIKMTRKGGSPESGWSVLDFGDVVTHIMTEELREFYALEQLWSDGKTVNPDDIPER